MQHECVICGHPYPEKHHVVYRGQQTAMVSCPHNIILLCYEHHRGNKSPHMDRSIDLKYKKQLQFKLLSLFSHKECYSEDEVKNILLIAKKDVNKLLKPLTLKVIDKHVGYHREDIVRQAMGGRLY